MLARRAVFYTPVQLAQIKSMHAAIRNGDYAAVVGLLENGFDPKIDNVWILDLAIRKENPGILFLLLEAGLDPHVNNSEYLEHAILRDYFLFMDIMLRAAPLNAKTIERIPERNTSSQFYYHPVIVLQRLQMRTESEKQKLPSAQFLGQLHFINTPELTERCKEPIDFIYDLACIRDFESKSTILLQLKAALEHELSVYTQEKTAPEFMFILSYINHIDKTVSDYFQKAEYLKNKNTTNYKKQALADTEYVRGFFGKKEKAIRQDFIIHPDILVVVDNFYKHEKTEKKYGPFTPYYQQFRKEAIGTWARQLYATETQKRLKI